MFRADKTARIFGRTSVLTAVVAAGAMGLAPSASQANTIGPITFDDGSNDFANNFEVVVEDPGSSGYQHSSKHSGVVKVSDGSDSGNDGGYAVYNPSGNGRKFNVSQITATTDVRWYRGGSRKSGPSLLGNDMRTKAYTGLIDGNGERLSISVQGIDIPNQYANSRTEIAGVDIDTDPNTSGDQSLDIGTYRSLQFTADDFDRTNHTVDLSLTLYDQTQANGNAVATVTVDDRNYVSDGLDADAIGEAGFSRIGSRNRIAYFDNYQLDFTPVPEPGSLALLGLVGLVLGLPRRRRRA